MINPTSIAVLFDLDGVFVETEYQTFQFYRQELDKLGIHLGDDDFRFKAGRKSMAFFEAVLNDLDKQKFDYHDLISKKREAFNKSVATYVKKVEGGSDLLKYLVAHGHPLALASQNEKRMIDTVISWLDFEKYFHVVLSVESITRKKPDPQIYLLAAERLGIAPARCVVVEDSKDGIEAAKAAGMKCVALFHDYMPDDNYTSADSVVKQLVDINDRLLASLI